MVYNCIRCLAATDNDYDICDNCLEETKNNKALMRAAEGFVRLGAEIKRLRAELASERNHVAGLRSEIARLREALEASKKRFEVLRSAYDRLRNKPIEIYGSAALAGKEEK